jgi:hypothetical protein
MFRDASNYSHLVSPLATSGCYITAMGRADINVWARRFAEDLNAAGTRILFERVVVRHLDDLGRLRELGLSWPAISGALIQAGARRADGDAISTDQLRAAYSRLMKRKGQEAGPRRKPRSAPSARPDNEPVRFQPSARGLIAPSQPGNRAGTIRETMRRARDLRRDRSED